MSPLTEERFEALASKAMAGEASPQELEELEPYRAKRAVLLASGMGSRLRPITINTPKPLVNVNGRRIIETLIEPLVALGIQEIYVVTGYLAPEFELLRQEYPQVILIYNPLYATTNNISSALAAGNHFENAFVFESDLYLKNPQLLTPYNYHSWYLGVPVDSTPDWCFDACDGVIRDLHKGGRDCYHMYGVSYWTAADGKQLATDLVEAFDAENNRQRFWDDVPCVLFRDHYQVHIKPCTFDDINEIDSLAELQEVDPRYEM